MKTIIVLALSLLCAANSFAVEAARVGGNLLVDGINFSSGGLPMTTPPLDGKSVRSGAADPIAQIGNAGDFYINTSTNMIFGPKVGSAWGSGVSLVGPQGPQGPAGQNSSGPWELDANTGNVWLKEGNVGIGTSVPSEQLELTGNLRLASGGKIMTLKYPLIHSTGALNFFSGQEAGISITTGQNNSAGGYQALYYNTQGSGNAASGTQALFSNTIGSGNSASGASALNSNIDGSYNTAIGYAALGLNTSGNNNTALGANAGVNTSPGFANVTGSNNTYIGANTGPGISKEISNATAIGANATVSQSNSIVLGTANIKVGIGTQAPAETLDVAGNIRALGSVTATSFATPGGLTASGISSSNGLDVSAGATRLAGGGVLTGFFNTTSGTFINGRFESPTLAGIITSSQINMANNKIINLADPTQPADVANKAYVDGTVQTAIVYGFVSGIGTCLTGCDKFSSLRTATGTYSITFTKPFFFTSVTTATAFGNAYTMTTNSSGPTDIVLKAFTNGTLVPADTSFTFISVGPK